MLAAAICQLVLAAGDLKCTEPMPAHIVERMMPSEIVLDEWRHQPRRFYDETLDELSPPFVVRADQPMWRSVVMSWEER